VIFKIALNIYHRFGFGFGFGFGVILENEEGITK
jgi:hypothetical protein